MRIKDRAFPHPVVGNGDDVDAGFQAPVQVFRRGDSFEIEVTCQMSSKSLQKRIQAKEAAYGLHVECTKTFYRDLLPLKFKNGVAKQKLSSHNVSGSVEVNVVAYATKEIPRYKVEDAHKDYGRKSFFVSQGDFLGITEGHLFNADIHQDMLRSVDSIMEIKRREDNVEKMSVDFGNEKIVILLPKEDYATYKLVQFDKTFMNIAVSSIVMPVLMEALRLVANPDDETGQCRWCDNLVLRMSKLELDPEGSTLENAQHILEMPVCRTL
jgi:hypothetical protein